VPSRSTRGLRFVLPSPEPERSTPAHVNVFGPAVAVIFDTSPKLPLELRRDKRSSLHSFLPGGANHAFNFLREEGFG